MLVQVRIGVEHRRIRLPTGKHIFYSDRLFGQDPPTLPETQKGHLGDEHGAFVLLLYVVGAAEGHRLRQRLGIVLIHTTEVDVGKTVISAVVHQGNQGVRLHLTVGSTATSGFAAGHSGHGAFSGAVHNHLCAVVGNHAVLQNAQTDHSAFF